MNKRVKTIRKTLGLNQEEFASRIGITSKAHISLIESGKRELTGRVIVDICREFNINEHWLRTGDGDMFTRTVSDTIDKLAVEFDLNELEKTLILEYSKLKKEQKEVFRQYFKSVLNKITPDETVVTGEEEEEESEYRASWNGFLTEEEEVALVRRRHEDNKRSFRSSLISEKLKRTNA